MQKKRNIGLELLRLVLMFGIVVEHATEQCAYRWPMGQALTNWCVCGFVFLSGYYGLKFSVVKSLKFIALGLWCAFISNILAGGGGVVSAIKGVYGYWFLWAYLILMMFAPAIDAALAVNDARMKLRLTLPILFLVYGWCFLSAVPVVRNWIPVPKGVTGLSFLSLIGIYVAARLFREFDLRRFCTVKVAAIAVPLCLIAMISGFWWYWWLPAFVISCFAFELFRRLNVSDKWGPMILFLAPSAFSIYLLHITYGGLALMSNFEFWLHDVCGLSLWLVFTATAIVTYVCCLCLDLLRRGALDVFVRLYRKRRTTSS